MSRKERFAKISPLLEEAFPKAEYELDFQSPYQLMVAITLAARCTDKLVNEITPGIFLRYPTIITLANANEEDLYKQISAVTYAENKVKYLIEAAKMVVENFGGEIPWNEADLQKLPGIGRKSANAILSQAFHKPAITVDTHVARVSQRLRIAAATTPEGIERELCSIIERNRWIEESNRLTLLGRRICTFEAPKCEICPVANICRTEETSSKQLELF
ncbi:MAG: endonuclease III [Paludibacteraceae bacterium]|nr:endonuclease III [Paludibacteraceae bacterium]